MSKIPLETLQRRRWWPGLVAAGLVLAIHAYTLAPTVTGEDSGELITAAYFFGVPHPPGYPLWTMLCGLWIKIVPFGSVAWRANLFSAVCTAGAVFFLTLSLIRMGHTKIVGGLAAAIAGLGVVVWSQSVISEVYTLNLTVSAALLYCIVCWHIERKDHWLLIGSLLVGLGMANHHIIGFTALALAVWVVVSAPHLLRRYLLAVKCVLVLVIGLLPYAYMIWAARRHTPMNWGETTTIAALWEHVSRGQYYSDSSIDAKMPRSLTHFLFHGFYIARWIAREYTYFAIPLLMLGLGWLCRHRRLRSWLWLTVLLFFCSGPLYFYASDVKPTRQGEFVNKVFMTPLMLPLSIILASGLVAAWHGWRRLCRGWLGIRRNRDLIVGTAAMFFLFCVAWTNGHQNNMREYWYAHDHAQNMVNAMLPDSIVFPSGDHNTFPLIYLSLVERVRPDVIIADKYGYIEPALYADMPDNPGKPKTRDDRTRIERHVIGTSKKPVYFTSKETPAVDNAVMIPCGVVYHLLPKGYDFDAEGPWELVRYRNLEGADAPIDHAAMNILVDYYFALAVRAAEKKDMKEASRYWKTAREVGWGMREIHNNVASAMAEYGQLDEAIGVYETSAKMSWSYASARWNLARIFKDIGRKSWAEAVFKDIVQATPGDFRPYGEIGFLMWEAGRKDEARFWFYESLRINPVQQQIIDVLANCAEVNADNFATTQPTTANDQ